MSGYRKNAANNRDALFGSMGAAGGATSNKSSSNKAGTKPASSSIEKTAAATTTTRLPLPAVKSKGGGGAAGISTMSAEARIAKQKEAEEYKTKANKCMESGIFKRPDPVAASTFYKRAADAYRVLNDTKLERLYRVESAECNRLCAAWPSAANDYTRAASLCCESDNNAEEASKLHQKAAAAWTEAGETAKAAKSQVDAAMVFHQQQQSAETTGGLIHLNEATIIQLERAVEAHVPDPLNAYARYRQTGRSQYLESDDESTTVTTTGQWSAATLALADHHLVRDSYAHEPVIAIVNLFASAGQFASALYAAGAVSKILSAGGMATLSLARAYFTETILTLAMGDPILANDRFLQLHLQDNFYLKSRECAAAEDLIRAIKNRDQDALDDIVRNPDNRQHQTAIANLPPALRAVVAGLRTTGVARLGGGGAGPSSTTNKSSSKSAAEATATDDAPTTSLNDLLNAKTGYEGEAAVSSSGKQQQQPPDAADLDAELDALDFGDADDDGDELDDDDDVDLR